MRSEARDLLTHCTHAPTSLREVRDPLSAGSPTLSSPTQWWERAGRVRGWEQAVAAAGRRLGDLAGPAHPDGCPQPAARSWMSPPTGASARRPHADLRGLLMEHAGQILEGLASANPSSRNGSESHVGQHGQTMLRALAREQNGRE